MVGDRVAAVGAGFAGLGDDDDEIPEVGVFQHAGEFAGGPEFRAPAWLTRLMPALLSTADLAPLSALTG